MDIINNGVSLKIVKGLTTDYIFKSTIRKIKVVKTDYVRVDTGEGINNLLIKYSDVVTPATANVQALRDAIEAMCQSADIGTTLNAIKAGIDSLNAKTMDEPLIVDETSPNTIYRGFAAIGSATNASMWAIEKITSSGDITTRKWAGGSKAFTAKWDDRETLSYS